MFSQRVSYLHPNKEEKAHISNYSSSLPVIVNVSPAKSPTNLRLPTPTILRNNSQSLNSSILSSYSIHTKFFQHLIQQYGINTISSVTQCVLDLALIVSVHSSLPYLHTSNEDYEVNYQQIIDPLKYTMNKNENLSSSIYFSRSDILAFYQSIKRNKANIRNAQCKKNDLLIFIKIEFYLFVAMRNVIDSNVSKTLEAKHRRPNVINYSHKRHRNQLSNIINSNGAKQQAHFTPIIELKPILGGSPLNEQCDNEEKIRKVTKIISTSTIQKDAQRISTIVSQTL